ncbi:hypothetical protein [Planotetraspora kaengkrachanensis]|uniref:Uncharacterized protein n=1 Tax=Planotetraspora kaengkrachanensis TaxID=575193 RepID=A0A8J3LRT4_9ACTN|nr:hypothetical protein [Planotetraspora kaengkrachanensis]GIG77622.1 hypothetical protein Pka01_07490 [Planotetraspora kaengkrachanensis]
MITREIQPAAQGRFVHPQPDVKGGFLSLLQGSCRGNVSVRLS